MQDDLHLVLPTYICAYLSYGTDTRLVKHILTWVLLKIYYIMNTSISMLSNDFFIHLSTFFSLYVFIKI